MKNIEDQSSKLLHRFLINISSLIADRNGIIKSSKALEKKDFDYKNTLPSLGFIKLPVNTSLFENDNLNEITTHDFESHLTGIDDIIVLNQTEYIISGTNTQNLHIIIKTDLNFIILNIYNGFENNLINFENNEIKFASDNEHIFISLNYLNEIFACYINDLSKIKYRFGKQSNNNEQNVENALDICYYNKFVYVLDSNKRIQVYSTNGDYEKSIYLYVPNLKSEFYDIIEVKNPQKLEIFDNLIAVLSNSENLYAFDLNGDFLQAIDSKNVVMSSFEDKYLLTITMDNVLICYEKSSNNNILNQVFKKNAYFKSNPVDILLMRKYLFYDKIFFVTKDSKIIFCN